MTMKVAAWLEKKDVVVREYNEEKDKAAVEAMEKTCEVLQGHNSSCLITDLLGDPLCRVRHFPLHLMLVNNSSPISPSFHYYLANC